MDALWHDGAAGTAGSLPPCGGEGGRGGVPNSESASTPPPVPPPPVGRQPWGAAPRDRDASQQRARPPLLCPLPLRERARSPVGKLRWARAAQRVTTPHPLVHCGTSISPSPARGEGTTMRADHDRQVERHHR